MYGILLISNTLTSLLTSSYDYNEYLSPSFFLYTNIFDTTLFFDVVAAVLCRILNSSLNRIMDVFIFCTTYGNFKAKISIFDLMSSSIDLSKWESTTNLMSWVSYS